MGWMGNGSTTISMMSPASLHIDLGTDEYPNGSITLANMGLSRSNCRWRVTGGTYDTLYYFNLYLCDTYGNNKYSLGQLRCKSGSDTTGWSSFSVNAPGLAGKSLFIVATTSSSASLNFYGRSNPVTVDTSYITYPITTKAVGNGTLTASATSAAAGTTITLTPTPGEEYKFSGYTTNSTVTITNNSFVMPRSAATIEALFEKAERASTFTLGDVEFGASSSIAFSNPYLSRYKHYVTWYINEQYTYSMWTEIGDTTASYIIPMTWMASVPDTTSITLNVSVDTYEGERQIDDTITQSANVIVPASVVPTAGTINISPLIVVQSEATNVVITPQNYAPGAYSSIVRYEMRLNPAETYSQSDTSFIVPRSLVSGTHTVQIDVIDSRGRRNTTPATETYLCIAYNPPAIIAYSAERCLGDGTPDTAGTYALISATATFDPMNDPRYPVGNQLFLNSKYYDRDTPNIKHVAQSDMTSGTSYIIGNGALDTDHVYYVEFTATDTRTGIAVATAIIQFTPYSIHVKNGGRGVAFGKVSEIEKSVEINPEWDLYYKGIPLEVVRKPIVCDFGTIRSLPVTKTFTGVTSNMEVFYSEFGTPSAFGNDIAVTVANNSVTISGTMQASTSSTARITVGEATVVIGT